MSDPLDPMREMQRHLRDFENQFDNAQGNLRSAGSLWMLAGLGGISGAFALDVTKTFAGTWFAHAGPPVLVSLVCLLVILGLGNLWAIDQFVYQRLLHAVFAYGMTIERQFPVCERVRTLVNARVSDVTHTLSNFYVLPISAYLAIFLLSNLIQSSRALDPVAYVLWAAFAVCAAGLVIFWRLSKKDDVGEARKAIEAEIARLSAAPP